MVIFSYKHCLQKRLLINNGCLKGSLSYPLSNLVIPTFIHFPPTCIHFMPQILLSQYLSPTFYSFLDNLLNANKISIHQV